MKLDKVVAVRTNKTIYTDGDRSIKLFNADHPKSDIFNEALNQARIEETGLNIPKVLEVTMIDGRWAIVSEFIKGKPLSQLIEEQPEKKGEYIELLVDLHMSIHAKTAPLLNMLRDKMSRMIAATELDATTRYDYHTRLEDMPKHKHVCHGDFDPSNVIITEDGTPYILDWSHAAQGNASADVARTYLLFLSSGDADGAEYYLDTYCRKSNVAKDYVREWIPIVAASQSVKGDEEERDFLIGLASGTEQP